MNTDNIEKLEYFKSIYNKAYDFNAYVRSNGEEELDIFVDIIKENDNLIKILSPEIERLSRVLDN